MGSLMAKQPKPVVSNPHAPNILQMHYWGVWSYQRYVDNVQREVDKMHPGKFRFDLRKDPGVTGRLEISISSVVNPAEKR